MGWSFKRFKENVRDIGRSAANVVQYAAPAVGQFLGPLGIVGGQVAGLAASQVGPTKDVRASLLRQATYGAGVFAAGAGLGLLSGQGALASPAASISSLFGGGSATGPVPQVAQSVTPAGPGLPPPIASPLSAGAQQVPATGPGLFEKLLGSSGAPIDNAAANALGVEEKKPDWMPWIIGGALLALVILSKGKVK